MTDNSITSMNELFWTGSSSWTLNQGGSTVLSLFDYSGAQAKIENQSSGLVTINLPITFAATTGNAWGEINAVNGNIAFGTGTLTVNGSAVSGIKMFSGGHTVTYNNTVSASGKWFGTTAVNSTATIGGSFTSGDFYVMNSGTLNLASGGSFTTSAVRLGGDFGNTGNQNQTLGGTFNLTSATGGQTFSSTINSVSGNSSGALLVNSANTSGLNTLSGSIFLDSALRFTDSAGGTLLLSGTTDAKAQQITFGPSGTIIAGGQLSSSLGAGGTLLMNGSGTLLLTNLNNTYTGTSSGTLNGSGTQITGGGTLGIYADLSMGVAPAGHYNNIQFTGSGTLQDSFNNISLNVNRDISVASAATATFDSSTNTFTVNGIINGSGSVTKAGSGTLSLTGNNTFTGQLTIRAGALSISSINNDSSSGVLGNSANSVILGASGSTGTLEYTGATASSTKKFTAAPGGTGAFQVDNSGTTVTLSGVIDGGGSIAKTGAGAQTLSGANSFGGASQSITLSAGTLNINNASALGNAANTFIISAGTIDNSSGAAITLANNYVQQWNGDFTFTGTKDLNMGGGSVTLNATRQVTVNNAGNLTVNGIISGSGFGLTKLGAGTLTLGAADTYSGDTRIGAGTLALNNSSALQSSTLDMNGADTGSLGFGTLTAATFGGLTGSRGISLQNGSSAAVALTIGNNNASTTYSGPLSGPGNLSKVGAGTTTLSGASTYSGGTSIQNGAVVISAGNGCQRGRRW